jgi:hypothetical protein
LLFVQTNGLTERFNQTLVLHLMRFVNEDANDWDDYLQSTVFGYRINKQTSAKYSPFELMYGVKPRLPSDLVNMAEEMWNVDVDNDRQQERMKTFATSIDKLRDQARENISKAQQNQKERYDIKHSAPLFAVGDKVLKFNRRRNTRMGDKTAPRYFGPYTVIEVIGKGVYRLADEKGPMKQTVNSSNLKQWHDKEIIPESEEPQRKQADDTDRHGTDYNQEKDEKENRKKERNNDKQGFQQNKQKSQTTKHRSQEVLNARPQPQTVISKIQQL